MIKDRNISRAIGNDNLSVARACNAARQINFAALGIDIFHNQVIGQRIIINWHFIVKSLRIRIIFLSAVIYLIHRPILHSHSPITRLLFSGCDISCRQFSLVILIATLNRAIDIDILGSDINIFTGDIPTGRIILRRLRILSTRTCHTVLCLYIQLNLFFQVFRCFGQIVFRVPVDVDNTVRIALIDASLSSQAHGRAGNARRFLLRTTIDDDIASRIIDDHFPKRIFEFTGNFHIVDHEDSLCQFLLIFFRLFCSIDGRILLSFFRQLLLQFLLLFRRQRCNRTTGIRILD